jgi:uncharacterized protein DUF1684
MLKARVTGACGALLLALVVSSSEAQTPRDIAIERAGYLDWLKKGANSPLAAVAREPVGAGLWLGPDSSDISLAGLEKHRVFLEGTAPMLDGPSGKKLLRRGQSVRLGPYTLYLSGAASSAVLTVFGDASGKQPPGYFDYDPALVFTGPMERSETRSKVRILSADGTETEATEVGSFAFSLGGSAHLRVLRVPVGSEESELEIFFRDETNGHGTYPAGRFVSLIPLPNGQFRLDFNRARNPFCAYSSLYPCPAPWKGNLVPGPVRAGERYSGGGLEAPTAEEMK